jgi:hypothetical protein
MLVATAVSCIRIATAVLAFGAPDPARMTEPTQIGIDVVDHGRGLRRLLRVGS